MKVYHNPQCSKSRKVIELLKEKNISFDTIHYLENPLSINELGKLCNILNITPNKLLRRKELIFKELLKKFGEPNDEDSLQWMHEHPVLMERPIVVYRGNAVIARPPEKVLALL